MIDTTNKIFRISCGAACALKLIGRKNYACVSCACLSMGGSHALFWSSHPVLEFPPPFGDLQAAVIPFSLMWEVLFFMSLLLSCSDFILTIVWRKYFILKCFNHDSMNVIQLQLCEFIHVMNVFTCTYS